MDNQNTPTKYQNVTVATTVVMAEYLGCDSSNIKKNFRCNKDRFTEGKHYYYLEGDSLAEFKGGTDSIPLDNRINELYLWTEKGAARHAKILQTDAAWDLFEHMEDVYFRVREQQFPTLPDFNNPAIAARAWADQVEQKQQALAQIEADKPKIDFAETVTNRADAIDMATFAKLITDETGVRIGRNDLFKLLRKMQYLAPGTQNGLARNHPYQQWVNKKWFKVKYTTTIRGQMPVTLITGRGQIELLARIKQQLQGDAA